LDYFVLFINIFSVDTLFTGENKPMRYAGIGSRILVCDHF